MPTLKIAIIGAGPAGCMLARLLVHPQDTPAANVSVTIFEGEQSLDFRSQGGTLDLHDESGLHAMKAAGLWEEFQKYARYDGEATKIADKNLLCYVKMGGGNSSSSHGRPEIDRPQLRRILYESLPEGTVQWNHKVIQISPPNTIRFANGTIDDTFDLIVGADGAWSKTRALLSDAKPYYSGIGGHSLLIPNSKTTHPDLHALVDRGSVFAFSDGKGIFAQYMSDDSLNVATWSVRPSDWQKAYPVHDIAAVKSQCAQEYADWDPRLRAFIDAADGAHVTPRDLYMLPIGHRWPHVPGVTLIGDAAHLATPFAGEGVNLALQDSERLARAILSAGGDATALDGRVRAFEEDMFVRATAMQEATWRSVEAQFLTPGAPRASIERIVGNAVGYGMNPWLLNAVVQPLINVFYFFFKLLY